MRLENILRAQAMRHPDKIALICGDERLTYRELELRVQRVANGLRKRGAGPGDRIVLFLSNGVEIVELFYAAFSVGAIVIPVTTRLTPHELRYVCEDSNPFAIVFEGAAAAISDVLQANPDAVWITTGKHVAGAVDYAELRKEDPGSAAAPVNRLGRRSHHVHVWDDRPSERGDHYPLQYRHAALFCERR